MLSTDDKNNWLTGGAVRHPPRIKASKRKKESFFIFNRAQEANIEKKEA